MIPWPGFRSTAKLRDKFPIFRLLRHHLHITTMHRILRRLEQKGIVTAELKALDIFGGNGELQTKALMGKVSSLEVWEIDPRCEPHLRRNLPTASIKITDSFRELTTTPTKFGLIVVDNPMSVFGPQSKHCEHFELFPGIFRIAMNSAILIVNVIPAVDAAALRQYPYLLNNRHREARRAFYRREDPQRIPLNEMVIIYKELIHGNGFELEWSFAEKRARSFVYSLVLKIKKSDSY
jgi:hypothetical protein